jgi:hypothetical protein
MLARALCRAEEKERNKEAIWLASRIACGAKICSVLVHLPCSRNSLWSLVSEIQDDGSRVQSTIAQGLFITARRSPATPGVVSCVLCLVVLFPAPHSPAGGPRAPQPPRRPRGARRGARSAQGRGWAWGTARGRARPPRGLFGGRGLGRGRGLIALSAVDSEEYAAVIAGVLKAGTGTGTTRNPPVCSTCCSTWTELPWCVGPDALCRFTPPRSAQLLC